MRSLPIKQNSSCVRSEEEDISLIWYIKIILHRSMRTQTKNRVICIIASNNQHILIMIITTSSYSPRQCLACEGGWCTWRQVLLGATQNAKGNRPENEMITFYISCHIILCYILSTKFNSNSVDAPGWRQSWWCPPPPPPPACSPWPGSRQWSRCTSSLRGKLSQRAYFMRWR